MEEAELFRQLREQAEKTWPQYEEWYGPLLDVELEESKALLGFSLPPFVRRVYTQVGNGGFGPGYGGVLGPAAGATDESNLNAVERYRGWREWQPDPEDYALESDEVVVPWACPEASWPSATGGAPSTRASTATSPTHRSSGSSRISITRRWPWPT